MNRANMDNGILGIGLMRDFRRKRIACLSLVLAVPLLLASCVEPFQPQFTKDEPMIQETASRRSWKKIAVLPFTGDPAFRRTAAEWFALQVAEHGPFEIIDPGLAEIELKRNGIVIGEAGIHKEGAAKAGRMLGADAVITGSLYGTPSRLAADLLDVATGKVIASSARTHDQVIWRGLTLSFDPHDYAAATAEDVAGDFLPVLYAVAGRPWTPPPKESRKALSPPLPGSAP